jgi:outer membrane lipoprotein carrier protein
MNEAVVAVVEVVDRSARRGAAMKAPIAALAALSLLLPVVVEAQQPELPIETVVANVQSTYDAVADFAADFSQVYTNQALGESETSTGQVYFLKPGMMRWDYLTPSFRVFITDGAALWIYEPEEAQYFTESIEDSDLPTALRFLSGEARLAEEFDIAYSERQPADRIALDLVPRVAEGAYTRLRFEVDPTSWQVIETTIYDGVGNTNEITFINTATGNGFTADNFSFTPPEGTRRIESPDE